MILSHYKFMFVVAALALLMLGCEQKAVPTPTLTPTEPPALTVMAVPPHTLTPTFTLVPSLTPTRTVVPSPTLTRTAVPPRPTAITSCPGTLPIRLAVDRLALVSDESPVSNRVRSQPGLEGEVTGLIGAGEPVWVEEGPQCADGYTWWYIQSFAGVQGWTAEGGEVGYWLVPVEATLPDGAAAENLVTLTAGQVSSAVEIEAAAKRATADGTRPGTVVLDGRDGPFVYTGDDRSINIFVSDLTLLGVNGAKIEKCADGLFFDDFPLENIRVEGIEFDCTAHGVAAFGVFNEVTLRGNIFRTVMPAVHLDGESSGWLIALNLLDSFSDGIQITGTNNHIITYNMIDGWEGITIRHCNQLSITSNIIRSRRWGIHLLQESSNNLVEKNLIHYDQYSGIILLKGVTENQILSNIVTCEGGEGCLSVDAPPEVAGQNTILGNLP